MANDKAKVEIKGDSLIITLPFSKEGKKSASGKSTVHASTKGNMETTVDVGGKSLVVGVNAYTKVD